MMPINLKKETHHGANAFFSTDRKVQVACICEDIASNGNSRASNVLEWLRFGGGLRLAENKPAEHGIID
jgi:hypothetical protein